MEAPFLNEIWVAFRDAKDFLHRRLYRRGASDIHLLKDAAFLPFSVIHIPRSHPAPLLGEAMRSSPADSRSCPCDDDYFIPQSGFDHDPPSSQNLAVCYRDVEQP